MWIKGLAHLMCWSHTGCFIIVLLIANSDSIRHPLVSIHPPSLLRVRLGEYRGQSWFVNLTRRIGGKKPFIARESVYWFQWVWLWDVRWRLNGPVCTHRVFNQMRLRSCKPKVSVLDPIWVKTNGETHYDDNPYRDYIACRFKLQAVVGKAYGLSDCWLKFVRALDLESDVECVHLHPKAKCRVTSMRSTAVTSMALVPQVSPAIVFGCTSKEENTNF